MEPDVKTTIPLEVSTTGYSPNTSKGKEDKSKLQVELAGYVKIHPKDEAKERDDDNSTDVKRKRQGEQDEDNIDVLTGIYLRNMYPLNKAMDRTVSVGLFESLDFQPAVLLNHSTKSSILFPIEAWDDLTQYIGIIYAFLQNNLSGKKTAINIQNSDIEVDSMRLKGNLFVRFRNLAKHQKKILLSPDEFYVLLSLAPAITRYIHQLVTYENLISNYLKEALLITPAPQLTYGELDATIYNKLPHEVVGYRQIHHHHFLAISQSEIATTNENNEKKDVLHEETSQGTQD